MEKKERHLSLARDALHDSQQISDRWGNYRIRVASRVGEDPASFKTMKLRWYASPCKGCLGFKTPSDTLQRVPELSPLATEITPFSQSLISSYGWLKNFKTKASREKKPSAL